MNTSITIQNVDDTINRWIMEQAQKHGVSVETIILDILKNAVRSGAAPTQLPTYHDLDALAGTWSEEQAQEFLAATQDFGKVEPELWR